MPTCFPTLGSAYDWLDGQVNYERNLGGLTYSDRVFEVESFGRRLAALGNPHLGLRTIHLAGSRGKGSAAAFLDALLRASGLTTARFTSPHLHEYRERIALDGVILSAERFARLLARVADVPAPATQPGLPAFKTVFEHLTSLFFLAAREARSNWAIVEVGLGGRLDATNVLPPGPVMLGRIALEHTHLLGNTLEAIAGEKAAILKPGGWAVAGRQASDPPRASAAGQVFSQRAEALKADLIWSPEACPLLDCRADRQGLRLAYNFNGEVLSLLLPIFGTYQAENIQNALALLLELRRRGLVPTMGLDELAAALRLVRIPGRMEPISATPEVLIDGAHCPAGAKALAGAMAAHFGLEPAVAVVSMLADKDHAGFFRNLAAWPHWSTLWCYAGNSPRALPARDLAAAARPWFKSIKIFDQPDHLLESVSRNAEKFPRYMVTGSLHSLGRWRIWGMGTHHGSIEQPASAQAQAEQGPGH